MQASPIRSTSRILHSRAALMKLTDRQRAIVVLRHVIGASFDDIAKVMGSNRTAMYAACPRAQRSLERHLRDVESTSVRGVCTDEGTRDAAMSRHNITSRMQALRIDVEPDVEERQMTRDAR